MFMWQQKDQMDKQGIQPSPEADAFATDVEVHLDKAEKDAVKSTRQPQATTWAMIAHNAAFAWFELTVGDLKALPV